MEADYSEEQPSPCPHPIRSSWEHKRLQPGSQSDRIHNMVPFVQISASMNTKRLQFVWMLQLKN